MPRHRILVSLITENNDYQREQAKAVKEASRQFDVETTIIYANNDAATQSRQILNYVQSNSGKPDAVICHPVGTSLAHVARVAVHEGIGWVVLNREMEYLAEIRQTTRASVFCVSVDQEEVGRIQARQIGALLPNGGTVLYVQGPTGNFAAERRTTGVLAMQPKNVQIHALQGDFTEAGSYEAIRSWLASNPQSEVHAIVSQNDNMAAGARRAFMEDSAIRWNHLIFTGCDAGPTGRELIRNGELAATITLPTTAGLALELLIHALDTGTAAGSNTVLMPSSFPALSVLEAKSQSR